MSREFKQHNQTFTIDSEPLIFHHAGTRYITPAVPSSGICS